MKTLIFILLNLSTFFLPGLLCQTLDPEAATSGLVGTLETGFSLPLREEANIDYTGFRSGRGFKVGAGYQFGFGSISLSCRRIIFPSEQKASAASPQVKLNATILGLDFDGYTSGKNKFHYALGLIWGNHAYRSRTSESSGQLTAIVRTKLKVKTNAGLRLGLGYARQLTPAVRLTADCYMDALGIKPNKDPYTQQAAYDLDAMIFHFTIGAQYCLNPFSR